MMRTSLARLVVPAVSLVSLVSLVAACNGTSAQGTGTLAGLVLDAQSRQPVASALVAVYRGSVEASATAVKGGDPNYVYGLATDAGGKYQLTVPAGDYALRVFAKGHHAGDAKASNTTEVALVPNDPADAAPQIVDAAFTPSRVVPKDRTLFTTTLAASSDADWLSHQVFLFEPVTHALYALEAPAEVMDKGWPDGRWQAQITASVNTGALTYTLAVASRQGVVSFADAQLTIAR